MPKKKNKKIISYFFLFLVMGTLGNKNLNNINFFQINEIQVSGLENDNNIAIKKKLKFLYSNNIFFLDKFRISKILNSNNLVQEYSVFKNYPSKLDIKITKVGFLAQFKKDNGIFLLGSNGRFIETSEYKKNLPYIFGNFKYKNFSKLKLKIDRSNFNFDDIKNLFSYKSGRWDVEMYSGTLLKLPKDNIEDSLNLSWKILNEDILGEIEVLDLRQTNQVVINGT